MKKVVKVNEDKEIEKMMTLTGKRVKKLLQKREAEAVLKTYAVTPEMVEEFNKLIALRKEHDRLAELGSQQYDKFWAVVEKKLKYNKKAKVNQDRCLKTVTKKDKLVGIELIDETKRMPDMLGGLLKI